MRNLISRWPSHVFAIFFSLSLAASSARAGPAGGSAITVDATHLTLDSCQVIGSIPVAQGGLGQQVVFDTNTPQTFQMIDDTYLVLAGGFPSHHFTVAGGVIASVSEDQAGTLPIAPGGFYQLSSDRRTIIYNGFPVVFDVRALTQGAFDIFGDATSKIFLAAPPPALTLLPIPGAHAGYEIGMGPGAVWGVFIGVGFDGIPTLSDPAFASSIAIATTHPRKGAGTPEIVATGQRFRIDARALGACGNVQDFLLTIFDAQEGELSFTTDGVVNIDAVPFYCSSFVELTGDSLSGTAFVYSLFPDGTVRFTNSDGSACSTGNPPSWAAAHGNRLILASPDNPAVGSAASVEAQLQSLELTVAGLPASDFQNDNAQLGVTIDNRLSQVQCLIQSGGFASAVESIDGLEGFTSRNVVDSKIEAALECDLQQLEVAVRLLEPDCTMCGASVCR